MARMGRKTAISDTDMETTVKLTSLAPSRAASKRPMPFSTWRVMFSSTTMASSTTKPVATVSDIRLRLSRVKCSRYMAASVPSRLTTTATPGIRVALPLRRNTSTTATTRITAISRVRSTSASEALIPFVLSTAAFRSMEGPSSARSLGSWARIEFTVVMMLAPGDLVTRTTMAGLPLARPRLNRSSGPSTMSATSFSRTGAPLR